jgi:hypothetical protein
MSPPASQSTRLGVATAASIAANATICLVLSSGGRDWAFQRIDLRSQCHNIMVTLQMCFSAAQGELSFILDLFVLDLYFLH